VKRLWGVTSGEIPAQTTGPPWTCQLVHAEFSADSLVLDLIALEPCPVGAIGCPCFTPFTIHVGRPNGSAEESDNHAFLQWAATADIVTVAAGRAAGRAWLCVSAGDRHLVLELSVNDRFMTGS
jgi:hypothetical protein